MSKAIPDRSPKMGRDQLFKIRTSLQKKFRELTNHATFSGRSTLALIFTLGHKKASGWLKRFKELAIVGFPILE